MLVFALKKLRRCEKTRTGLGVAVATTEPEAADGKREG